MRMTILRARLAILFEAGLRGCRPPRLRHRTSDPLQHDLARLIVEFVEAGGGPVARDRLTLRARDRLHRDLVVTRAAQCVRLARAAVLAEYLIGRAALRARPVVLQWAGRPA